MASICQLLILRWRHTARLCAIADAIIDWLRLLMPILLLLPRRSVGRCFAADILIMALSLRFTMPMLPHTLFCLFDYAMFFHMFIRCFVAAIMLARHMPADSAMLPFLTRYALLHAAYFHYVDMPPLMPPPRQMLLLR